MDLLDRVKFLANSDMLRVAFVSSERGVVPPITKVWSKMRISHIIEIVNIQITKLKLAQAKRYGKGHCCSHWYSIHPSSSCCRRVSKLKNEKIDQSITIPDQQYGGRNSIVSTQQILLFTT